MADLVVAAVVDCMSLQRVLGGGCGGLVRELDQRLQHSPAWCAAAVRVPSRCISSEEAHVGVRPAVSCRRHYGHSWLHRLTQPASPALGGSGMTGCGWARQGASRHLRDAALLKQRDLHDKAVGRKDGVQGVHGDGVGCIVDLHACSSLRGASRRAQLSQRQASVSGQL